MNHQDFYSSLAQKTKSKIVVLVSDGLGGLPQTPGGKTELETAKKPNLDALAKNGISGLGYPVLPGVTPGSGPGHLALFSYDPLQYEVARGVFEALGVNFDLQPDDIAIRANFCTIDKQGLITDRRAGRIPTATCVELVEKLKQIKISGVEIFLQAVQDYRFMMVLRGKNLGAHVTDTDPQTTGVPTLDVKALDKESEETARIANEFRIQAKEILKNDHPANMINLRGFGKKPQIPSLESLYKVTAAGICVYPMYKGFARLVGMDVIEGPKNMSEQLDVLKANWNTYDVFFVHFKYTDSRGEDGKFDEKVKLIEELDTYIPQITALQPDVLVVTADHSSPAPLAAHSFHPVPILLDSKICRPDGVIEWGEKAALQGELGRIEMKYIFPLALAHAGKLKKFGA